MIYTCRWATEAYNIPGYTRDYPKNHAVFAMVPFIGQTVNYRKTMVELINQPENTLIFILRKDQVADWATWVEENGLKDLIVFESGGFTNPIHYDRKGNLCVKVLASKDHVWRSMFETEGEEHVEN